ncbi:MAG: hypothetical protein ACRC2R_17935 [Xenococcaceae cyanobacterium]
MAAISISANLEYLDPLIIYKAQHDAIVLCNQVIGSPDTTLVYTKRLSSGSDINLPNLQGVFLGKGSQLLAQANKVCRLEITLMSRTSQKDYQVVYPVANFGLSVQDFTIDSQVCSSCSGGARGLQIEGSLGTQINLDVQDSGNFKVKDSEIEVIQWFKSPQCFPLAEQDTFCDRIGILTNSWRKQIVTLVPPTPTMQISFVARNPDNNYLKNLICFDANKSGDLITIYLLEFAGTPINPYG